MKKPDLYSQMSVSMPMEAFVRLIHRAGQSLATDRKEKQREYRRNWYHRNKAKIAKARKVAAR